MRTDADDPARVRDPAMQLLLIHTATLTNEWCSIAGGDEVGVTEPVIMEVAAGARSDARGSGAAPLAAPLRAPPLLSADRRARRPSP